MTPYYRHFDSKHVRVNEELIILTEILQYCENNNVEYIRYLKLKNLCNERLNELTNGASPDMGGNFDNNINNLTSGKNPFIRCVKISTRHTRLYPNIPLIKAYRLRHVDRPRKSPRVTVDLPMEPESVTISDGVGLKVIHARGIIESMEVTDNLGIEVIHGPLYYIVLFYFLFQGLYLCG